MPPGAPPPVAPAESLLPGGTWTSLFLAMFAAPHRPTTLPFGFAPTASS
eukprot:CAMPEP_0114163906 /NCGR_PEP_ID=MMETSP0043_2-20121206/30347_1 /TAXON_ID=464988 /ORGANISM="Hemiselmis andersenii, Strain CCMP644" /LENGTH=48 /DNA_ID= /DNA_START= /DNA_END= /DNA_ORIENTATION=